MNDVKLETKVELLPLDSILPYEKNNKVHTPEQIEHIANSIVKFGFNQPIVIDETSVIIAGHGRRQAALKLGLKAVPCIRCVGLSNEEKVAYRLTDNRTADEALWHNENIRFEVEFLKNHNFDIVPFGIDGFKVPEFEPPVEEKEKEPDEVQWAAVMKLSVPASDVEDFEVELDSLLARYPTVQKERKKK